MLGCGALQALSPVHGEIKSMRIPVSLRRRGAGRSILKHILATARQRGFERLSLETGTASAFAAAHRLYESEASAAADRSGVATKIRTACS